MAPATADSAARVASPPASVLHILNGDCAAERLRAAGITGQTTLAADLLYEGPAFATSSLERWRRERARFLAQSGYDDYEECLARLAGWDHALEGFRHHDEVVLWFEHDLFDQLHLCRLLSWFSAHDAGFTRVSLVQADDYLGRMQPHQLAGLLDTRRAVTSQQMAVAHAAWDAFCSPQPTRLEGFAAHADTGCLPYLAAALTRHLEEFPGCGGGLSRAERQAIQAACAAGGAPIAFGDLFRAVQDMEERVFMPDLSFLRRLQDLAAGPRPLLRLESPGGGTAHRSPTVAATGVGARVLAGHEDWVDIRGGLDRWLGGVHLHGRCAAWRWDRKERRLVAAAP
jgi:hypothetical protein